MLCKFVWIIKGLLVINTQQILETPFETELEERRTIREINNAFILDSNLLFDSEGSVVSRQAS
jgi:hypothetical protein